MMESIVDADEVTEDLDLATIPRSHGGENSGMYVSPNSIGAGQGQNMIMSPNRVSNRISSEVPSEQDHIMKHSYDTV